MKNYLLVLDEEQLIQALIFDKNLILYPSAMKIHSYR